MPHTRSRGPTELERYPSVNAAPLFDETGGSKSVVTSLADITDRRERQRELGLLQQSIDGANDPITPADPSQPDEPLVYVNDPFGETAGYPPGQALGRNCRLLRGADIEPKKTAALRDAIDDEELATVALRNCHKDGAEFWARLNFCEVQESKPEIPDVWCVGRVSGANPPA